MAKTGKKTAGRFGGLTEEEVKRKDALPDYLEPNLDIVFLGINPSLMAAHKGRYYAGPGNHFYKLLHASGLVPRFVNFDEDHELLQHKIGLTNIVERATRSSADLTKAELKKGCNVVVQKMIQYKPKIAVFNGKCIYQVFAEQMGKTKYDFGLQNEKMGNSAVWVVPSSSARCSNFPRMEDKLPFFLAIKKHLQYLREEIPTLNFSEFNFNSVQSNEPVNPKKPAKKRDIEESPEREYLQYAVVEILDGTQNKKKKQPETVSDENIADNCSESAEKQSSCDSESSESRPADDLSTVDSMEAVKKRLLDTKDIETVSEVKKTKKLNFSNIIKNRGVINASDKTFLMQNVVCISIMAEIIRSWLRSRLGVIIDLTPEKFGHYCRDGTFLAKLLHSYDIINDMQLHTIVQTSDPALARVNLRHLRVWLKFIGVDCDNKCVSDISQGKGAAALHLFYKIFLCLEDKDRLHFITQQEEREKYIPNSTKFDVKVVSEEPSLDDLLPPPPPGPPLSAAHLAKSTSLKEKKKEKLPEDCKRERENFLSSYESKESDSISTSNKFNALSIKKNLMKNEMAELDEFTRTHKTPIQLSPLTTGDERRKNLDHLHADGDPKAAKRCIKTLKNRKREETKIKNSNAQMRTMLVSQVWEKIASDQDRDLDRVVAEKVLQQSQYEKQMVKKLCDIRNEHVRIASNRKLVDDLMQKTRENDVRMIGEIAKEEEVRDNEEINVERRRLNELDQRIKTKAAQNRRLELLQLVQEALEDLINISVIASQFKRINNSFIPEQMWEEWRTLFVMNLPIFQSEINPNIENIEEEYENTNSKYSALNDKDFEDYHKINPPWTKFMPAIDQQAEKYLELGGSMLAQIVNRVLQKSSHFPEALQPPLPPFHVQASLVGVVDSSIYVPLQDLLNSQKIRVILIEDAINYCLQCYKDESADFDQGIKTTSIDNAVSTPASKRSSQSKKRKASNKTLRAGKTIIDKQTQTPKVIPYDDMHAVLSDAACVGQWINQFLSLGQAISDELTARIIVEYLKSLSNVHGWLLINYPNTYDQLKDLEFALSGHKFIYEKRDSNTIDEIHSQLIFDLDDKESNASCRISRLLPSKQNVALNAPFCLTRFIKLLPTSKIRGKNHLEDAKSIDKILSDRGLLSKVSYTTLDPSTLQRIIRCIVEEPQIPLSDDLEETTDDIPTLEGLDSASEAINPSLETLPPLEASNWSCVELRLPLDTKEYLSTLWTNMEEMYIREIKKILGLKRFIFSGIIPYKDFVTKHMEKFIGRPDSREELLQQFLKAFNDVEENIRRDEQVKYELKNRVEEFQEELWDLCDRRRLEAANERREIIRNHWTGRQATVLMNAYVTMLQIEADRSVDTLRFIDNYYRSLLQRPLEEDKFRKIFLRKLNSNSDSTSDLSEMASEMEMEFLSELDIRNEVCNFLLSLLEDPINPAVTLCRKIIQVSVNNVQSAIDDIMTVINNSWTLEKKKLLGRGANRRGRGDFQRKNSSDQLENIVDMQKLFSEWENAVMFEINRIGMRLKLFEAAAESDIEFLLVSMRRVFKFIHKTIIARYEKEVQGVNDMAKVFSLVIERETAVLEELCFDEGSLVIHLRVITHPDMLHTPEITREGFADSCFTIQQLEVLKNMFQSAAPSGSISQRSLAWILQDLITCGGNEHDMTPLPANWYDLTPQDVVEVLQRLFGRATHVDWREFFIYALGVNMPSVDELLDAREAFEIVDSALSRVLYPAQFMSVPLWFLKSTGNCFSMSSQLVEKEMSSIQSSTSESSVDLNAAKRTISFKIESLQRKTSEKDDEDDLKEHFIPELLCQWFLDCDGTVNYMTMLMAFCKDADPRRGFAKAFSLRLGKKICFDVDEGENYVKEVLKMQHGIPQLPVDLEKSESEIDFFHTDAEFPRDTLGKVSSIDLRLQSAGPIVIQSLDVSVEQASLIAEEHSSIPSIYDDLNWDYSGEEISETSAKDENMSLQQRKVVYWLPMDVCESVMRAVLPVSVIQEIIFDSGVSLTTSLKRIYREVYCELLNSDVKVALVHRILNHDFVSKLINLTGKFTSKNLCNITEDILRSSSRRV